MKAFTRDFLTGLVGLISLVGLAVMMFLFGELSHVGEKFYSFSMRLDTAGGLSPSGAVSVNGLRVGNVVSIRPAPEPTDGVDMVVRLREQAKLTKRFTVLIERSFVGETVLELTPAPSDETLGPPGLVQAGDHFERTADTSLGQLAKRLEKPLDTLTRSAARFDEVATTYNDVGKRINDLLEPRTPDQVAAGAPPNIASVVTRIDASVASANQWLGDADLRAQTKDAVSHMSTLVQKGESAADAWAQAATHIDEEAARAGRQLEQASAELTTTLRAIGQTSAEVNNILAATSSGQGTLGLLLRNPDLYRSLNDAATRLDRTLTEAQLLIQKYRSEGVPIRF
jgi:phospholipid/cholesterol/gamma-HCH transport system substrate-binding protein